LHRSDNVGSTRARSNEDDTGLARGTGITLGHVTSTLLVLGKDEFEVLGVVNSIENGEHGTTGVTEDVLNTLAKHHLVEDLSTTHSNHRVIELGELAVLQGRNLIAMGFLVKRGTGYGSGFRI
jgi:hypothetical protein